VEVVGIVLAAGAGRRMRGAHKQLLPVGGRPLLQHVIDAAHRAGLQALVIVTGHREEEVAAALDLPPGARMLRNPDHAEGQASSLRAGIASAPPGAAAALVLLGDQPEVRADAIRAVAAACGPGVPAARASYGGRPGHPVLLDRSVWPDVARLRGDRGARELLAALGGRVAAVEVGGDPPADIDTPEAYRRLLARFDETPDPLDAPPPRSIP
jgi:molybdenum cofactor cytidylyltransferase